MVEFAAAALSSLAGGIGSAASAVGTGAAGLFSGGVASTAGTALLGAGATSIFSSILQGGAGVVSAMGAVRQGQEQAANYDLQATSADLDASQTSIQAISDANSLKQKLVATIGQRDVAYGASGVDLSFGTPVVARNQAVSDAADALTASTDDSVGQAAQLKARAAAYRQLAASSEEAGDTTATGLLLSTGAKILGRG